MYYRLKEPWSFCGWKELPYALRAEYGEQQHKRPRFLAKDVFLDLLYCNGQEEVDPSDLCEDARKAIEEMLEHDMMEASEEPLPALAPWQRYHVFPARFAESVHWAITGKCNFRCRHCLVSAPGNKHPELPLSDCEHIMDEIARCGIRSVDVTGGEPLVRSDYAKIYEGLSKRGISIGVVFTNASLLTPEVLDVLDKYGQHPSFQLSFDGVGHHDWLRGIPGAEREADAALALLQERGYRVSCAMCIHRGNRDSLRETVKHLASLGVVGLRVNAPQELGVWKLYSEQYALSKEEVWEAYRDYIPHFFEDGMPCGVELDGFFSCKKGSTDYTVPYAKSVRSENPNWDKIPYCESVRYKLHIRPDGRVAPCMGFSDTVLGDTFPSVLEEHLGDILLKSNYRDVVDTTVAQLMEKNPECATCEHLRQCCGGCMVEDITDDGDYLVPDQKTCFFHKHVGEAAVREVADAAISKM